MFRPSKIRVGKVVVAMAQKAYSLSHTKWMCKYHIVFTPKYRCFRQELYEHIDVIDLSTSMSGLRPCRAATPKRHRHIA